MDPFLNHFSISLHSIVFCISFRCTAWWLDNYIFYRVVPPIFPSPTWHHTVITVLLMINPSLYLTSPWLFCNCQFVLLNPSTCFTQPPLPSGSQVSVRCSMHLFLFVHLFVHLWYLSFSVWLILLNIIPSRSIHAVANGKISFFLWPSNILLYICTDRHLGCFRILAIINNTAMNIGVYRVFQMNVLSFLGYIPISGIAGP